MAAFLRLPNKPLFSRPAIGYRSQSHVLFKVCQAVVVTTLLAHPSYSAESDRAIDGIAQYKSPMPKPFNSVPAPVPTHRFWAAKNWFPTNLTNEKNPYSIIAEPLAFQTTSAGLLVGYSSKIDVQAGYFIHEIHTDFLLGVEGLNAVAIPVSGYTDWTVDFNFGPLTVRVGRGMPFVYATTDGRDPVITFTSMPTVFRDNGNLLGISAGNNNYGLFCPSGGKWTRVGRVMTCHLPPGKKYLSVALLPDRSAFALYSRYAFSFPENTQVRWAYNAETSQVTSVYSVTTRAREGSETGFLQALYPHQYGSLNGLNVNTSYSYASARGSMKVIEGSSFTTVDTFHGLLPFLPLSREKIDQTALTQYLNSISEESTRFGAPDTYGTGKRLGRIAQLLPIAAMAEDRKNLNAFKLKLEDEFGRWLQGRAADNTPGFFYESTWGTLIGIPASFGSDNQLNDHHFHYGYWIHAAALLGLYDPKWLHSARGGAPVTFLARDLATPVRQDSRFPFLRHFDVYAGHSWASGQAPFADGENEESTSEAINAWAGLILYASEIGDINMRDAAIWMYTLETNSAFDYWFNAGPVKTFPTGFEQVQIANLFDGKADTATWFSNSPAMEHGIQFIPFTGASLYLGCNTEYVRRNLAAVTVATEGKVNVDSKEWPDLMEMYLALYDPKQALESWSRTSYVFDGESRAHEYAWLTSLQSFGTVDCSVTANVPFYAVFRTPSGGRLHIAFNLSEATASVRFSDGTQMEIPANAFSIEHKTTWIRPALQIPAS